MNAGLKPSTPQPAKRAAPPGHKPEVLLVDNGSLRAASTLALRRLARQVAQLSGQAVSPVSVLHSDKVAAAELDGQAAETALQAIRRMIREGKRSFVLLPLFFGPTNAMIQYLPDKLNPLFNKHPDLRVRTAPFLSCGDRKRDQHLLTILEDHSRAHLGDQQGPPCAVILVDHGTPEPAVNAIRNHLAHGLRQRLGKSAARVIAASMERRPGPAYAFNDPLLEDALNELGAGKVVVTPLFLHPGRHAGPGGDVERIIAGVKASHPHLQPVLATLVGEHALLAPLLAQRLHELDDTDP